MFKFIYFLNILTVIPFAGNFLMISSTKENLLVTLRSRSVAVYHVMCHLVRLIVLCYIHCLFVLPIFKLLLEDCYVFTQKFAILRVVVILRDLKDIRIVKRKQTPVNYFSWNSSKKDRSFGGRQIVRRRFAIGKISIQDTRLTWFWDKNRNKSIGREYIPSILIRAVGFAISNKLFRRSAQNRMYLP